MKIYFDVVRHKDTIYKSMVSVKKKKDIINIVLTAANAPAKEHILVNPRDGFLQFVADDSVLTFILATTDDDQNFVDIKAVLFQLQEILDSMDDEEARPAKKHPCLKNDCRKNKHCRCERLPIKEVVVGDGLTDEEIEALDSLFYRDTDRMIPTMGEIYKNRFGKLFSIIAVSHWGRTEELVVTLRAMQKPFDYTTIPLDEFMSKINREKHPNAQQTYQFELVDFWG